MFPLSVNELASRAKLCSRSDDPHALDEVISLHYIALGYYNGAAHAQRGALLGNLGCALKIRFQCRGNDEDLDNAVALFKEMLDFYTIGHPDRPASLSNIAGTLFTRFMHRGNSNDLDEAIALHREALTLRLVGHPNRHASLHNLANMLSTCFSHRGNGKDLDDAIALHREALILRPVCHPDRHASLHCLANTLAKHFLHRGNDSDLDEAIALYMEALVLRPVGHPNRLESLNDIAVALSERFSHRGIETDLDKAIALHREILTLWPVGHPNRLVSLHNLAHVLSKRFMYRGKDDDIDEAITLYREALVLQPIGHIERHESLNNVAIMLSERFEHRGDEKDLDEALALHRDALTFRPAGHRDRTASLNNLANVLCARFEHRSTDKDLDDAISFHEEALALLPVDHRDRPVSLNNYARATLTRYRYRNGSEDLDKALANARSALTLLVEHHPYRAKVHISLAAIHLSLYRSCHQTCINNDLDAAIHHIKAAVDSIPSGLLSRLRASLEWVRIAEQYTHSSLLDAYSTSIRLLDTYMATTASVSSRHRIMKLFPSTLAVHAASCALDHGDVCRAVELLEQGRTLIWNQMARFRALPLDTLQEHGVHAETLANKFRELSSILNNHHGELPYGIPRVKGEAEATQYSRLVDEWNSVVQEIRNLEGFSRFMLPPLFSDLQNAARDGPIIILIASRLSCNAIIIAHRHSPVHMRLGTSVKKLMYLVNVIHSQRRGIELLEVVTVLRELWVDVIGPVVEILARLAQPGSRIWWCPTMLFNFLPLHAAGEYRRGGMSLSRLYVSSYTPSLTALIRARSSRHHNKSHPSLFAAIGQNHPSGYSFTLEHVEPELDLVHDLLPPSPTVYFIKVTSIESTKSRALRELQDNHWLHIACHCRQNSAEPFNSAFLMRDQPLTLIDITQTDLSKHEFAFLSACDTALGDLKHPDEAIHLAAGLQFVGVKSVIGTFWEVEDATVGRLVEGFYRNFCGDGKMKSKRAARALHAAVQSSAKDKNIPLLQRVVFMHIGI